jgi:tetratricopeptide (TPR) repeat protein
LPGESRAYRTALEREHGNLLAALHWCILEHGDTDLGLRLAAAMGRFWYLSEQWREGAEWLQRALNASSAGGLMRAQALVRRAELYTALSEHARAHADFQEGIALLRQADQPSQLAWALFQAGALCSHTGDDARALVYFDESLELYRTLDEQLQIAMVQIHRGSAAVTIAQYASAAETLEESLPIFRAVGNEGSLAVALNLLGRAVLGQGDPQRAILLFNDALSISQRRNSREGMAWGHLNLGLAFMVQQSLPAARQAFRESLQDARQVERRSSILAALEGLGFVLAAEGAAERAVRLLAASEALRMQIDQQLTRQELELRDVALEHTRALLPDAEWQAAWRHGRMLTLEQAISVALR